MRLHYAARSDVGLVRQGNEDSGYASPNLLVVADGMGGHAAGELASATAVAALADIDDVELQSSDVLAALAGAVDETGEAIRQVIARDPGLTGMGTTVTAIYWMGERIAIAHVGDTRAYLLRRGELTQLTHDHTFVQTLVDEGRITEEEAAVHPRRSIIMRALDGLNPVEPDLSVRESRVGDRYLLCSDGMSGVMSAAEIGIVLSEGDPTGAVTRLVELALERGAPDNVTVVVADVVDAPDAEDELPVVVGAAGEPRVRDQLPEVRFPADAQPDLDRVEPAQPEQSLPRRRSARWMAPIGAVLAVAVVLGLGIAVTQTWLASRWYVAVNGSAGTGTVAVYNGVPGSLLGISLSSVAEDTGISVGMLPLFDQELVSKGIPAASRTDADRIVIELQQRVAGCQVLLPPPGCPGVIG